LRLQGQVKALVIRKCHNKSVVALAHKILRTIYAMLSSGTHYKDRVVDCEALNVVRDAPSLVEDAAQARLHRRPRYRLKERFIPAALPRPGRASGQDCYVRSGWSSTLSDAYNAEGYWDYLTIFGFAIDNRNKLA